MNIAIIGCGYVSEFYAKNLSNYPELKLVGAFDRNGGNLDAFARRRSMRKYDSLEDMLSDSNVELVLNLTNPRSHYEVTKRCLRSGKHVYSEKPLAMTAQDAHELVDLAESSSCMLSSAPCSVLSETAQTLWKAIRQGLVGRVRLVYAAFDDGIVAPGMAPWTWRNESGVPWPARDEFEVGCTYEHGGYVLTWLAAFFGPALNVTSFASCLVPDKGIEVERMAPDFTVACIEYADGVVARVTCGLVAPRDKSITIVGDEGVLYVGNIRNDCGPVMLRPARLSRWQSAIERRTRRVQRWLEGRIPWPGGEAMFQRRIPLARKAHGGLIASEKPVDFMRGPAEMALAIREERPPRLSAQLGAHIVELVDAIQNPVRDGSQRRLTSTFTPVQPMSWAL